MSQPVVVFGSTLIDRGRGSGARRFMLEHPEVGEFIRVFTGWSHVEPGSLTCDGTRPLPLGVLGEVRELAEVPVGLIRSASPRDEMIAALRGPTKYYGGIIEVGSRRQRIIVGQQPRPAVEHRLEVLAESRLRSALSDSVDELESGSTVRVEIYHDTDWPACT